MSQQTPKIINRHVLVLEDAYVDCMDRKAAELLAKIAFNEELPKELGQRLRECRTACLKLGKDAEPVKEVIANSVRQHFGGTDALAVPRDQAVELFLKDTRSIPAFAVRAHEQQQLLNDVSFMLGEPTANYIAEHLSQQRKALLNEGPHTADQLQKNIDALLKDDVWLRVKRCVAGMNQDTLPQVAELADQVRSLSQTQVENLLDRVKQYQLHWEGKQDLPRPQISGPVKGVHRVIGLDEMGNGIL